MELDTYRQTRQGLDEMYSDVWKQLKEEKKVRLVRPAENLQKGVGAGGRSTGTRYRGRRWPGAAQLRLHSRHHLGSPPNSSGMIPESRARSQPCTHLLWEQEGQGNSRARRAVFWVQS